MPEGDTIYRTAVTLRDALVDRVIADATSDDPHVDAELLIERRIVSVEPRGKHLLVDASGVTIHSHMGMKGAWHVYGIGVLHNVWICGPKTKTSCVVSASDRNCRRIGH